jgi:hypothetical protein
MPDLDLIKQGEQGSRDRRGRPLERDRFGARRGREGGYRDAADVINTVRHMVATRRLRPGAPACHTGAKTDLLGCHSRRQHLNRCADKKRQRQANRQETFPDRRHARKTWLLMNAGQACREERTLGSLPFRTSDAARPPWTHYPRSSMLHVSSSRLERRSRSRSRY